MTVASEAADAPSRLRELQRVLTDNPVIILVLVLSRSSSSPSSSTANRSGSRS